MHTVLLATMLSVPAAAIAGDKDKNEIATPDRQKILKLVNDVRAKGCKCGDKYYEPASPVSWNNKLEMAAIGHSVYMRQGNYLSHAGLNGNSAGDRIKATGYEWVGYGENIAAGYESEESVVNGWVKSAGHCKNIMNGMFTDLAVGRCGNYWTMVLAR
jgi:uncharacterized protein YkwD